MSFFNQQDDNQSNNIKNRLEMTVLQDRLATMSISEQKLQQLKSELFTVLEKYFIIDSDQSSIILTQDQQRIAFTTKIKINGIQSD